MNNFLKEKVVGLFTLQNIKYYREEGINITSISDGDKSKIVQIDGNIVKLWGTPKASTTKLSLEKG